MRPHVFCSAVLALSAALALPAVAAPVFSLGSGSAVTSATHSASFESNTGLATSFTEGGLHFSTNGLGNNGGCGYAGVDCVAPGGVYSEAFDGNYFATVGSNAYLAIGSGSATMQAVEFAVDSGYGNIFVLWQTWLDGAMTGSGKASLGLAGVGAVVGLSDSAGFDEVRLYSFDSASDNSGYSAPAIDSVVAYAVPEPTAPALVLAALAALALQRRRRVG